MEVIEIRKPQPWLCPKGHQNIEDKRSDIVRCSTCGVWCDGGFPLVAAPDIGPLESAYILESHLAVM